MQGGKHQVTRETGLHGNLGRFQVTYLADHHHVGILTEDRPKAPGKGHFDFRVHL